MNQRGIIGLLLPIRLIIAVIIVAVYLFQSPQIFKPKAAEQANSQEHIISKAIINSQPYLYNKSTGKIFIPRGNVYANTRQVPDPWGGTGTSGYEWFYPNEIYDTNRIEQDLQKMENDGYNSISVGVSYITIGSLTGTGLNPSLNQQMLRNIADFIQRAKNHKLLVYLGIGLWPHSGGYAPPLRADDPLLDTGGGNVFYLSPVVLKSRKRYITDLINGLKEHNTPMDNIWAYGLDGELAFSKTIKPFVGVTGPVTTNAGVFDMTNMTDMEMEQMMDKNIIVYVNDLTDIVKSVDPSALVSIQIYPPALQVPPGQQSSRNYVPAKWIIATPDIKEGDLQGVKADIVGISMYPNTYGKDYDCQISSLLIPGRGGKCGYPLRSGVNTRPLFVLEMGYVEGQEGFMKASQAVPNLKDWMKFECNAGIRGWFTFTWSNHFDPSTSVSDYFTALEDNEAINNAIKPTVWPNICGDDMDLILITGDADGNGSVDIFDYNLLLSNYGKNGSNLPGDFDGNSKVDIFDYNTLISNYGR